MSTPSMTKEIEILKTESVIKRGGARIGAGRKPRLQYDARELFYGAIDEEWDNIIKVLRYHVRRGDKEVMKWLVEQRVGRAPQTVDVSSRNVSLNISAERSDSETIDIMQIAAGVSAELKRIKTVRL